MHLYRLAWVVLLVDAAYWVFSIGHDTESGLPRWHAWFNVVTFYGGWLLLLALLLVALGRRRSA